MDKHLIYKTNNEKLITFIFGQLEKNAKKIEEACDVILKISEEGILISGSDFNIESASNLLESLNTHTLSGNEITDQDLDYLLSNLEKIKQENISKIKDYVICYNSKGKPLKPKTVNQRNYVEMIKKNDIVFGIGPAGTGKTYLAMAMAINAFRNNEVDRIILTRPAVEAGESLGFLPGDLQEKIDPYLRPIYDAMFDILGYENFEKFKERGLIEVAPLAYMRGRTLDNAYIILDEAQNTTNEQMKMFLTRIGYGIENSIKICLIQELNDDNYEISLSFVSEEEIKELNRDYRNKDSVTDVLSFPLKDDFQVQTNLLGDIIICCKRAVEQAKEYNHSIKREIVYLVVHSMFHLLGYDHIDESDKIIMRNKEKSALKEIGIYKDEEFN